MGNDSSEPVGGLPLRSRLVDILVDEAPIGFALFDRDLRFIRVNRALAAINGVPADEHIGRTLAEIVPDVPSDGNELPLRRVLETGEPVVDLQVTGRTAADPAADRTWLVSYYPVVVDGEIAALGAFVVDITARRAVEEALREREESVRLAIEATETGAWHWSIGADAIQWSESVAAVHGLPPGTTPSRFEDYLALVHPEDRSMFQEAVRRSVETGEGYELEWRVLPPDGSLRWIWARADIVPGEGGRATRLVGVTRDVSRRRRADEQRVFLERATEVLFGSLDEQTLSEIAALAVEHLADWCSIDLVAGDRLVNVAVAHVDSEKVRFARELQERYPPDLSAPAGTAQVIRTGAPALYETITDEMLVAGARDEEHLRVIRNLGLRSAIVVPLASREGVLGAVTLASAESGRAYGEEDMAFAAELARRARLAIENARLHASEREARRAAEALHAQTARLQRVTERLSAATTVREVVDVILADGVAALQADAGIVYEQAGRALELVGSVGYAAGELDQVVRVALRGPGPHAEVVRRGDVLVLSSPEEIDERHGGPGCAHRAAGDEALIVVPLAVGPVVGGTVVFAYRAPRTIGEGETALALTIARQCAQALERARLYEREHEVAETLQRSMLPESLPSIPGIRLGARYLPGVEDLEVGGDWYDAIRLPDGRIGVTIGDVVGKGVFAAAAMGQLRNALRAYALEGHDPGVVVRRLAELSSDLPGGQFATLVYLVLEPRDGLCRYANAGHVYPLRCRAGGGAEWLEQGRTFPIGSGVVRQAPTAVVALDPGDTVLLYTDGLVERRQRPLGEGLDRLYAIACAAPPCPDELLEQVLAGLGVSEREDDVAVLAVTLSPSG